MAFWGRHGSLSTVEAATLTLQEISREVTWDDINIEDRVAYPDVPQEKWYMALRLVRQIEGLQMVLWLNNSPVPATWLPQYFKPDDHAIYRKLANEEKVKTFLPANQSKRLEYKDIK